MANTDMKQFSKAAVDLLKLKYCGHGEQPVDVFKRVARVLGSKMQETAI